MGNRKTLALLAAIALVLTGCSAASDAATAPAVETIKPSPTPTSTPTPTPTADPGTRTNPLQPGQMLKLSALSMWTVGPTAATELHDGYIVLPLHVDIDWEAGKAQGLDPDNEGSDPSYSILVSYVSAAGRSFNTMDDYTVDNAWFNLGVVYPPTTSVDAGVPISIPADQVAGGVWKIENTQGDAVFIAGG